MPSPQQMPWILDLLLNREIRFINNPTQLYLNSLVYTDALGTQNTNTLVKRYCIEFTDQFQHVFMATSYVMYLVIRMYVAS